MRCCTSVVVARMAPGGVRFGFSSAPAYSASSAKSEPMLWRCLAGRGSISVWTLDCASETYAQQSNCLLVPSSLYGLHTTTATPSPYLPVRRSSAPSLPLIRCRAFRSIEYIPSMLIFIDRTELGHHLGWTVADVSDHSALRVCLSSHRAFGSS